MRKILVINRLGIGDVVLTTPLAQLIKENLSARVGFVVAAKAADLLVHQPYIDDVFSYKSKSVKTLIKQIKELGYNEAVIVDGRLTSTFLAFRAGCQLRNKGYGITIGKKRLFSPKPHARRAILDYASYIEYLQPNIHFDNLSPVIGKLDVATYQKIDEWFNNQSFGAKTVLIVSQGLTENKNWTQAGFSQVTQGLNQQDIIPIYVGSRENEAYINQIVGEKVSIAGQFSLRELAYIATKADLCITICSGPMHVIATAKIPIIALYGPTSPERWAPSHAQVLKSKLSCVPCETLACTHTVPNYCMQEITPAMVLAAVGKQLKLEV
ncbi:Glycosyl transferase family 9 [uncultured Sporomusa sp.]|uniref:Glycosyl transferase family 9 n=1 Tax=uncultured Sporomusa sp. TaxID=307249 RepID=A0A212M1C4_9FIRM|nr:glycosyltransferase family 9 protein [uncultured Sporomusa sp.]SCM83612.1 Glycosyl transferase family 9 [uncultured Sporomusa sp.]